MKLLFLFLSILGTSLYTTEFYYDEDNIFLNVKPGKEFIRKYFYKPLSAQQQSIVALEVMSIDRIENVQEICKIFEMRYDREQDACFDDGGMKFCEPKSIKEMQDYMLKFIEIPINFNYSGYMFMENNICGYEGKVKAFGYVWDFESRGGGMELSRKLKRSEKIFSINENALKAYKQGRIDWTQAKANKYLVCIDTHCNPRAEEETIEP